MFNSLKFQISATLLLLLTLFAAASSYTFMALEHQRTNDTVLILSTRLQLTVRTLSNQAMRYKQHAPRDYQSYYRDLDLYYKDLLHHVDTFDMISDAFMHQEFQPEVTGLVDALHPKMGPRVLAAIRQLETDWANYRAELFNALGEDPKEPRLEWGAEYIMAHNQVLENASARLSETLRQWSEQDLRSIRRIHYSIMLAGGLLAAAVIFWLFFKVIVPINRTMRGFRQVTQGGFGLRVEEQGSREVKQLTREFNHLSARLKVLFQLIERLQQGSDLDQTLAFLSREFQTLLRIDWIGALFVTGDGNGIKLESAYLDGQKEHAGNPVYRLEGTLLDKALGQVQPLHIADMQRTADENPGYAFLRTLIDRGMRDAIFLPLDPASQSPVPGVLVFSTRVAQGYDPEHLVLLHNIAHLVTHSFGRTVKLARHAHLAAVGEFASGIAHEIRNPLATVGMALEHFGKLELPDSSAKRARLASMEVARMTRLLEDMLLYAKPLRMQLQPLELGEFLQRLAELHGNLAASRRQRLELATQDTPLWIRGDPDRLAQVWVNLTRNACEAAPEEAHIRWTLMALPEDGLVEITVRNPGEPIDPELLPRLTQPFFTTKASGTGLGLAIVARLVEGHGGDMRIHSDSEQGTRVVIALPHRSNAEW